MAQLLAAANNVIYEWFGGTESRRSIERSIGWHANVEGIRQWVERLQAEEDGTWGSEGTPGRYPYKQVLAITQRTLPERQERQARHVKDCPARSSEDKYEDASGRHYEEARPRSHTPTHAAMVSVPCSAFYGSSGMSVLFPSDSTTVGYVEDFLRHDSGVRWFLVRSSYQSVL